MKTAENVVVIEKKECQLISFDELVLAETCIKAGGYEIQSLSIEVGERMAGYSFEKEALVIVMKGSGEVVKEEEENDDEKGEQIELDLSVEDSSDEDVEEVEEIGGMMLNENDVVVVPGGEGVDFVNVGEGVLVLLVVL